jgi:ferredoxin
MASYNVTLVQLAQKLNKTIKVRDNETIIKAASDQSIELPYACMAGACTSCVGKLTKGSVNQDDQSFLTDDQIDEGWVLTCVAYPTSDCTIETHTEEDFYAPEIARDPKNKKSKKKKTDQEFSKDALLERVNSSRLPKRVWSELTVDDLIKLLHACGFETEPSDASDQAVVYLNFRNMPSGIVLHREDDHDDDLRRADFAIEIQTNFSIDLLTLKDCNEWNNQWIFGQCHIDSDNDAITMKADLMIYGGVSSQTIMRFVVEYLDLVDDFSRFIDRRNLKGRSKKST